MLTSERNKPFQLGISKQNKLSHYEATYLLDELSAKK